MEDEDDRQKHADRMEYDTLVQAVQDSKLPMHEKDAMRELLTAGYRNLNGDPIERKVQLLARVDWAQIKRSLADADKLNRILAAVEEIRADAKGAKDKPAPEPAKPMTKIERILVFIERCRNQIAATAIGAFVAPHGPDVVQKICDAFR